MTLIDLCRVGVTELVRKLRDGRLEAAHVWVAVRGAGKYRQAILDGDVADAETAVRRLALCMTCPSRVARLVSDDIEAGYCGVPFEEHFETVLPTCGCLVSCTVRGETRAAGKALVASEKCPQGWNGW